MRRSRKIILIALLTIVVLAGSIGGIALAQTEDEDSSQPETRYGALLDKVCGIYNTANPEAPIDGEALKDAFAEARSQMCPEGMLNRGEMDPEARQKAMLERLQALYDEGKITEEQFNRKTEWMESMPDKLSGFGFRGHGRFPKWGGPCAPQTN